MVNIPDGKVYIPYPDRLENKKEEEELYESFSKALSQLKIELRLTDAIRVPTYQKFLRYIINRKKPVMESIAVIANYPPNSKVPAKLTDPGIPTITCGIGKKIVHNALYDLGAGVSAMPVHLYRKLGLHDYVPTSLTL